jgi:hypothetical protein
MSETEKMNVDERRKYIHKMWKRYREADKKEKSRLLDEIEAVTSLHRKSITRTINGQLSRKKRSRQRGRVYGIEVEDVIRVVAKGLDYPCAERLQPNLVWMAQHLKKHAVLTFTPETEQKLASISVSTLKRILRRVGRSEPKLAERKPKRPQQTNSLLRQFPTSKIAWDIKEVGHFEVDLVHHCGVTTTGEYIHSLQMIDVATGWSELVPIFGRSFRAMSNGFDFLLSRLPFPVLEIHPDNGAEFFNQFLIRYWEKKLPGLSITRSRPFQKNDNRFVEENNQSLVRAYVGHGRFDTLAHLSLLRRLYDRLWLFHNFFQPVMRLKQKAVVSPTQFRRIFDQARPPVDRLKQLHLLPPPSLSRLDILRDQTNPLTLRSQIDDLISQLLSLPTLDHSDTVNIFETMIREVDISR